MKFQTVLAICWVSSAKYLRLPFFWWTVVAMKIDKGKKWYYIIYCIISRGPANRAEQSSMLFCKVECLGKMMFIQSIVEVIFSPKLGVIIQRYRVELAYSFLSNEHESVGRVWVGEKIICWFYDVEFELLPNSTFF